MEIRDRIAMAREHAGLNMSQLSKLVGVSPSAGIQWEAEGGTSPAVENLAKIAAITGVSFEWLATGRGPMVYDAKKPTAAVSEARQIYLPATTDEERLVLAFREMPDHKKKALLDLLCE